MMKAVSCQVKPWLCPIRVSDLLAKALVVLKFSGAYCKGKATFLEVLELQKYFLLRQKEDISFGRKTSFQRTPNTIVLANKFDAGNALVKNRKENKNKRFPDFQVFTEFYSHLN